MRLPRKIKKKLFYAALSMLTASGCFTAVKSQAKDALAGVTTKAVAAITKDAAAQIKDIAAQAKDNVTGKSADNAQSAAGGTFASWNGADLISEYSGEMVITLNGNVPYFTDEEITREVFEHYSDLDALGRCGQAYANICTQLMPIEERGEIGMIKPSGWHTVKYPDLIEDLYLYNRCHLIAFCLAGENANEKNLVTGTRYLNETSMLPYEVEVAQYAEDTGNHVLYRATPIFVDDELTCRGIELEALSVEDNGAGVSFHIFLYNEQPGITIDHATGESRRSE